MELREIETLLFIEGGAPVPVVISNEYKLSLLYYYAKPGEVIYPGNLPKERLNSEDRGVATVVFKNYLIYKFGYPNAEILQAHPYYSLGLDFYKLFELIDSEWIDNMEKMNRVHPFHNPIRYKKYRHFIITFEDSTFECIAQGLEISFSQNMTMDEAVKTVSVQLTTA